MNKEKVHNRMFDEMLKVARMRLAGRSPEEISKRTGIPYDSEYFRFHTECLGETIFISYPEYEVSPLINEWHFLTILHYMDMSDGTVPANQVISFSQLKNGMVRGGGFDNKFEKSIELLLKNKTEAEILRVLRNMNAEIMESNADICARFFYLPNYPLTLKIWLEDEEFPCSGRLFLDASADHHLTVEDAVTVGEIFLEKMAWFMKKEQ